MKLGSWYQWLFFAVFMCVLGHQGFVYLDEKHTQDLAAQTKQELVADVAKDSDYSGVSVKDLSLIKEGSNKYTGFVDYAYGTDEQKVNITVTVDHDNMMYQADPPTQLILKKQQAQVLANFGG